VHVAGGRAVAIAKPPCGCAAQRAGRAGRGLPALPTAALAKPWQPERGAGSRDGHAARWRTQQRARTRPRNAGRLIAAPRGDRHVVNVAAPHPTLPWHFASCGIDRSVKLWAPTAGWGSGGRLGLSDLIGLAENELKRTGTAGLARAREMGLGDGPAAWVPDGGLERLRYLARPMTTL
jgi:hypothetical protein